VRRLGHGPTRARNRHDPAAGGEVDELLEPVRSWPQRTMLTTGWRRDARQPSRCHARWPPASLDPGSGTSRVPARKPTTLTSVIASRNPRPTL
jgi:hypothetical protein